MKRKLYILAILVIIAIVLACNGTSERTTSETTTKATADSTYIAVTEEEVTEEPAAPPEWVDTPRPIPPTNTPASKPTDPPKPIPPTNTPAPQATDTPKPEIKLQVGSYTFYVNSIGTTYCVGELLNTGDVDAEDVQIALSLLDDQGTVLAAESSNLSKLSIARAQGKYPFKFMMGNIPDQWAEEKIQIQAEPYEEGGFWAPYLDLDVQGVTATPPQEKYDYYTVTGQVVNGGEETAESVHIVAVLYDDTGSVMAVDDGYAKLDEIAPGGNAPFSIKFLGFEGDPASYEVFVQGRLKN